MWFILYTTMVMLFYQNLTYLQNENSVVYVISTILIYSLFLGFGITGTLFLYYFRKLAKHFAHGINLGCLYVDKKLNWKVHFIFSIAILTEIALVLLTNHALLYSVLIVLFFSLSLVVYDRILDYITPDDKRVERFFRVTDELSKEAEEITEKERIPLAYVYMISLFRDYIKFKLTLMRIKNFFKRQKQDKFQETLSILNYVLSSFASDMMSKMMILHDFQNEYFSIGYRTIDITGNFKVISKTYVLDETFEKEKEEERKRETDGKSYAPNVILLSGEKNATYYYFIRSDKPTTFSITYRNRSEYNEILFLKKEIYSSEDELAKVLNISQ